MQALVLGCNFTVIVNFIRKQLFRALYKGKNVREKMLDVIRLKIQTKTCISTTCTEYIPNTNKLVCTTLPLKVPRL